MGLTFEEATDLMLGRFKEQLDDDYPSVIGGPEQPTVYWENIGSEEQPPKDAPWMRVEVKHFSGSQNTIQEPGQRRFGREGLITVQIFVPAGTRGRTLADRLGKIAVDAFEGKKAGEVWFRDVTLNEVGNDGPWFQVNVRAGFTYDETK